MIPRRFGPAVFAGILSGLMSLVVSGISTFRTVGLVPDYFGHWIAAWLSAWLFAFPMVMIAAPLVRRCTDRLLRPDRPAD